MRKVTKIALPLFAAIGGVALAQSSGNIVVPVIEDIRAQSTSTFATSCGAMKLKLVAPYGDSVGASGIEPVKIILNGRRLDLKQAGMSERIGLKNRLYKYAPLCSHDLKEMYVLYYSIYRESGVVRFTVDKFTIFSDGRIIPDSEGEELVDKDDFWFGSL